MAKKQTDIFDDTAPENPAFREFERGEIYDFYKPHQSYGVSDWGPSLTRQEFAEDADINTIMKRYEVTGQLPVNGRVPQYLDLTSVPADYHEALQAIQKATDAFMQLPASVRAEFKNDPGAFVAFAEDPENLSQLQTWGLAPPSPTNDGPALAGQSTAPTTVSASVDAAKSGQT